LPISLPKFSTNRSALILRTEPASNNVDEGAFRRLGERVAGGSIEAVFSRVITTTGTTASQVLTTTLALQSSAGCIGRFRVVAPAQVGGQSDQ
jgi:hypothetical protein